VNPTNPLTSK